jgi:hypothetical protein
VVLTASIYAVGFWGNPMMELKQMPQSISISQSSDPSILIGLGKDWERLNAIGSPTVPGP